MTLPYSFTLRNNCKNTITWNIIDKNGAAVNSLTLKAFLYSGRSLLNPKAIPGVIVSNFPIDLPFQSNGNYSGSIAAIDFSLDVIGGGYVLVVEASDGVILIDHWERPVVVI